ncbi:DUF6300 family protein [Nocardia sp. NPDC003482]
MTDYEVTTGEVHCHRCGRPALLTARVPHRFQRDDGTVVEGARTVVLCSVCDGGDPDAQGVLAFFALHESVDSDNVESAGSLIGEWIDAMAARPTPDLTHLDHTHHPEPDDSGHPDSA